MKARRIISGILWMTGAVLLITGCESSSNRAVRPVSDTVVLSQMKFHPQELYINKWDTVVWINRDLVSHDITAFPDKTWTSDTIKSGSSWKKVFGENADYFCSIHPTMKGKIMIRK